MHAISSTHSPSSSFRPEQPAFGTALAHRDAPLLVNRLFGQDRAAVETHHLALDPEDRRLRFGIAVGDATVRVYVAGIDFVRDAAFGIFDGQSRLAGVAHLARGDGGAELGLSVLPPYRRLGFAGALLACAHDHARALGLKALSIHCLAENAALLRVARKGGLAMVTRSGESHGSLQLFPALVPGLMDEDDGFAGAIHANTRGQACA